MLTAKAVSIQSFNYSPNSNNYCFKGKLYVMYYIYSYWVLFVLLKLFLTNCSAYIKQMHYKTHLLLFPI